MTVGPCCSRLAPLGCPPPRFAMRPREPAARSDRLAPRPAGRPSAARPGLSCPVGPGQVWPSGDGRRGERLRAPARRVPRLWLLQSGCLPLLESSAPVAQPPAQDSLLPSPIRPGLATAPSVTRASTSPRGSAFSLGVSPFPAMPLKNKPF